MKNDVRHSKLVGGRGPNIYRFTMVERLGMPLNRSGNWRRGGAKMAKKMAGKHRSDPLPT